MGYSKYKNKKVEVDGHKFDSQMEKEYYDMLLELKEKGIVVDFQMQVAYLLQEKFKHEMLGNIREINYKADFVVEYADGHVEVIDVKGTLTTEFKLKRKMLLHRYPNINFKCVRSRGRKPNKVWEQIL